MTVKKRGRPPKPESRKLSTQISLRVKDDLRDMLDVKVAALEEEYPGTTWNRCDVVRYMLYKVLKDGSK